LVPCIDRVRARVDLRKQVVSFAPQPVITENNLVVDIDTVLYFQVTDPRAATYEIANRVGRPCWSGRSSSTCAMTALLRLAALLVGWPVRNGVGAGRSPAGALWGARSLRAG
jgi:regulator of protease activity HflC (stomatin/prohibitin superfamily)